MADSQETLPDHVTVPLLTRVTAQSLDQDYAQAAARRGAAGSTPPPRRRSIVTLVAVLALFGLLVGLAAAQRSRNAATDETSRAALIEQIETRREVQARTQDRIGRLRANNTLLEARVSKAEARERATTAELARLQTVTGYGSSVGPGVRLTVDDAPTNAPGEAVRDSDLALLADALWGVGAEAISVNGQRLTVRSGFRNVGAAVHVNGIPLSPPYVLDSIGDPRSMQSDLVDSPRGQDFLALVDTFGFEFDMTNRDSLTLPGATLRALRWAQSEAGVDNKVGQADDRNGAAKGDAP
jgi:uncharacterized protein YlxW (UPF0749 family)